ARRWSRLGEVPPGTQPAPLLDLQANRRLPLRHAHRRRPRDADHARGADLAEPVGSRRVHPRASEGGLHGERGRPGGRRQCGTHELRRRYAVTTWLNGVQAGLGRRLAWAAMGAVAVGLIAFSTGLMGAD